MMNFADVKVHSQTLTSSVLSQVAVILWQLFDKTPSNPLNWEWTRQKSFEIIILPKITISKKLPVKATTNDKSNKKKPTTLSICVDVWIYHNLFSMHSAYLLCRWIIFSIFSCAKMQETSQHDHFILEYFENI